MSPSTSAVIQSILSAANFIVAGVLAFFTAKYVKLSRNLLEHSIHQARLTSNPVIGIRIQRIFVGEFFGKQRQNLSIDYELTNLSDAPAISVTIDAEIILKYVAINEEHKIPQRFDPEFLEFLKPGESVSTQNVRIALSFGNSAAKATLDDLLEAEKLNFERIKSDPSRESHRGPRLRLVVRYSNNLGQRFKTEWEVDLGVWNDSGGWKMPDRRENIEILYVYVPRPSTRATPESETEMTSDVKRMSNKRNLSGW